MQQSAQSAPSSAAPSFAGLLAALASPKQPKQKSSPDWDDDALADDVATLSYESALKTHSRYRPSGDSAAPAQSSVEAEASRERAGVEAAVMAARKKAISNLAQERGLDESTLGYSYEPDEALPEYAESSAAYAEQQSTYTPSPAANAEPRSTYAGITPHERNLKCASITIRLSQSECEKLRARAAEADLTVSAYLRSCAFEVESLRAQVKQTLADLRTGETKSKPPATAPAPPQAKRSWLHWPLRA
jgi:hypothetical protein